MKKNIDIKENLEIFIVKEDLLKSNFSSILKPRVKISKSKKKKIRKNFQK